jgi:hypothetical protein
LILFFPPCGFEPAMLEESVSNHGHERVAVEALPGSPLEVVETQFFFQLLVSLLAIHRALRAGVFEHSLLSECHRWTVRAISCLGDRQRRSAVELELQTSRGWAAMFAKGRSEETHGCR